jgi:putative phosphoesterase
MLLGILSDTHNRLERTARAVEQLHQAGIQTLIHCGDITHPDILALFTGWPTYFVQGNNDDDEQLRQCWKSMNHLFYLQTGAIIELEGKRIAVTHGHLYREVQNLLQQQPDYLLSGHTHISHDKMMQATRCINPGALHRASEYTVATLDLITNQLQFLPVPT